MYIVLRFFELNRNVEQIGLGATCTQKKKKQSCMHLLLLPVICIITKFWYTFDDDAYKVSLEQLVITSNMSIDTDSGMCQTEISIAKINNCGSVSYSSATQSKLSEIETKSAQNASLLVEHKLKEKMF